VAIDARIKEIQEKRDKVTGTGKGSGGSTTRSGLRSSNANQVAGVGEDDMEVDEEGGGGRTGKGRKTGRGDENKGFLGGRFTKRRL
jgi:hypothetical protein